jgi:putative ABC transport system substrate-binding protein
MLPAASILPLMVGWNARRPGGNVTGLSMMYADINAKRLQLLKEAVPRLTRVAVLWNPDNPYHQNVLKDLKAEALSLLIELHFASARRLEELAPAFEDFSVAHAQALYVVDDAQFVVHPATLVKLAAKARLPMISAARRYTDEGPLMSYGARLWRSVAPIGRMRKQDPKGCKTGGPAHRATDQVRTGGQS